MPQMFPVSMTALLMLVVSSSFVFLVRMFWKSDFVSESSSADNDDNFNKYVSGSQQEW